jgi:hypothetical protein
MEGPGPAGKSTPGRRAEERHCVRTSSQCANWIIDNLAHFLVSPQRAGSAPSFDDVKALAELSIALFALARPGNLGPSMATVEWAEGAGRLLMDHADSVGAGVDIAALRGVLLNRPRDASLFVVYPLLEAVIGTRSRVHDVAIEFLTSLRDGTALFDDVEFAIDLMGIGNDDRFASRVRPALRVAMASLPSVSSATLYDLSHAIFYATQFGRRTLDLEIEELGHTELLECLDMLTLTAFRQGCCDAGAEVLLCQMYCGETRAAVLQRGEWLLDRWALSAAVAGRGTFHECYHGTLVCLMAGAEVWRLRAEP